MGHCIYIYEKEEKSEFLKEFFRLDKNVLDP